MKKILLLLAVTSALAVAMPTVEVQAQIDMKTASYNLAIDTVTNTGTKVLYFETTGYKETITAIISLTRISGTLGGTLKPVVSSDGTTWYDATGATAADTVYTVTNSASQGKAFTFKKGFRYYGAQWTGTGTMSGSFTGKAYARRPTD